MNPLKSLVCPCGETYSNCMSDSGKPENAVSAGLK